MNLTPRERDKLMVALAAIYTVVYMLVLPLVGLASGVWAIGTPIGPDSPVHSRWGAWAAAVRHVTARAYGASFTMLATGNKDAALGK